MDRIFLLVMSAIFLALGYLALTDPIDFTNSFGMEVSGRHGAYEVRGIYGGVGLAAGILFLIGTIKASMRRAALIFLLTYSGGYAFARFAGLVFDGQPEPFFWGYIGFETVVFFISAVFLLRR